MQKVLAEIKAVPGVRDSFLCDSRGELITGAVSAGADTSTLGSVGRQIAVTWAAMEVAKEKATELDLVYSKARLVSRNLGNAILVVLCEPQIEITMPRLTLNVTTLRLKSNTEIRSQQNSAALEKKFAQTDMDKRSWDLLTTLREGATYA